MREVSLVTVAGRRFSPAVATFVKATKAYRWSPESAWRRTGAPLAVRSAGSGCYPNGVTRLLAKMCANSRVRRSSCESEAVSRKPTAPAPSPNGRVARS